MQGVHHFLHHSLSLSLSLSPTSGMTEPSARALGGTEYSWCRGVPGGTGITVLALLLSQPPDASSLQNALHNLQNSHPILRSKLQNPTYPSPSFSISPSPTLHLDLQTFSSPTPLQTQIPPFHLLLERELNRNPWSETQNQDSFEVFFATLYSLPESSTWVLALRLHTSVCDRTSVVALSSELLGLMGRGERVFGEEGAGIGLAAAIEEMVPKGKGEKPFWARGVDLVGYSLNSLRISNLEFEDYACSRRESEVVRLQMSRDETHRLLSGCRKREIKLCGALAAAGLIAASSRNLTGSGNYSIVTLIDCRKILDPVLNDHHLGFYFAAILNTHNITNGEELWDVARRSYTAFSNAKKCNKHFTDMGDLNFLMCKAIENPGLTPSSSQRTAFMSVFEDTVVDDCCNSLQDVGLEDYIGCSSVHGIGPSIAIFDTIRDEQLDCACVYPSPLHSRKQMQELIDDMKKILVGGGD